MTRRRRDPAPTAALVDLLARYLATVCDGSWGPYDHLTRWRARLSRTRDLGRLRFDDRGAHLANNVLCRWRAGQEKLAPHLAELVRGAASAPGADPCEVGAEAVERAWSRGAWPWDPADDTPPRWLGPSTPPDPTASPPDLETFLAVASRGPGELLRAAELGRGLAAERAVVWGRSTAEGLSSHHRRVVMEHLRQAFRRGAELPSLAVRFSIEQMRALNVVQPGPAGERTPAWPDEGVWPTFEALALGGFHIIDPGDYRYMVLVVATFPGGAL